MAQPVPDKNTGNVPKNTTLKEFQILQKLGKLEKFDSICRERSLQ